MKSLYISCSACTEEPGYTGVINQENKGAAVEKHTLRHRYSLTTWSSYQKEKNKCKWWTRGIKRYKSAHQDKDGLDSPGLREKCRWDIVPMNMINSLLLSVQDENYGAAGP